MYYALADQLTGELIQVSAEPLTQGEGQIVKLREGDIPDLTKFEWHNGSLAFIQKQNLRTMTQETFVRRFTDDELVAIYTAAKSVIQIEVWLDRFKMAKEIDLEDPFLVNGIHGLEYSGLLAAGRAQELLA